MKIEDMMVGVRMLATGSLDSVARAERICYAIETLQRDLEEARKDGARLSYVLENGRPDIIVNDNDECGYGYYSITGKGEMVRWHATKIEAIDYARTPPPNTPTTKPDAT